MTSFFSVSVLVSNFAGLGLKAKIEIETGLGLGLCYGQHSNSRVANEFVGVLFEFCNSSKKNKHKISKSNKKNAIIRYTKLCNI